MLRPVRLTLLVLLCSLATGAQWDLIQVLAWGRMMAQYTRTMPVAEAAQKTFGGEMCGVCRMVARAREPQRSRPSAPPAPAEERLVLFLQDTGLRIARSPSAPVPHPAAMAAVTVGRQAPPVPPPRPVAA